jgi:tetratricopeptide (TPR) repeat protein
MAIEKIEGAPKVEWTPATLIQLGVSVVLVLLSFLFGWLAFSNWRFKVNLVEGYQEYDRGRPPVAVKQPLEAALSWRPTNTGARELLAKVLCDEGALDAARNHYKTLDLQGYKVPQVHIGLGVLALKEAETLNQPKQIEALVNEAAAEFKQAPGVPEAEIGIGHCDLVLARKLGNPAYYTRAQATFKKIQTAMEQSREFRAQITRDGLIDYYTGLGKALSSIGNQFDENARAAFLACYQYTPTWSLPMSNVLSLEARRFAQMNEANDVLLKLSPDITALRTQARLIYNGIKLREEKDAYREAWIMFSLALGQAWGRAGNLNELSKIVTDLSSGSDGRAEHYTLDAQIKTELAVKDDPNPALQEQLVSKAGAAYNELLQRLPGDDANRERRARAYNDAAWMLAWRGGYLNNEGQYQQAVARMIEALRLYPEDYVFNRNMAVILKRFRKPPSNPAAFVDKCRAAVAKDKDFAEDFDKLQKYMETK